MKAENIQDIYELSPLQQGVLFHSLYTPESGVYFVQVCSSLRGNFNVVAFEQAWQQVVARHAVLRTAFYWENLEKPVQVVHKQVKVPLEEHDWRWINPIEQQESLEKFLLSDRASGFDFSQAPLMRLTLIRIAEDSYYFVWSKHILILDGWSTALVLKEVVQLYEALCHGQNVLLATSISYGHYIGWLQQQDLSKAEAFWKEALSGIQAPTPLISLDVDNLSSQEEKFYLERIKLSEATTTTLQSFVRQHQLTLNTLVQGAWAVLLRCYSGEEEVVYGATVSGRPVDLVGVESIVGVFINTLPMRVKLGANQFLLPWLKQLQAQLVEIRQYEYSPLVEVQGWSEVPRGWPLFESILVFENYPVDRVLKDWKVNLEIQNISAFEKTNYPLTVIAIPGSELEITISYDCRRFDAATINRMLGHFQTLLQSMVTDPEVRLKNLRLLTEAEEHQLLKEWNDTQADYPQEQCIHQLFADQVERTPDTIAVMFEDEQLTYCELNARANQLGHYLRSLGVGSEVLVGICVERSLSMVIGLLGILKAGGAYVPLDPAYPQQRLAFMLEDAQLPVLLTQQRLVEKLPEHKAQVVCLDTDSHIITQQSQGNPVSISDADNLAYVIYTSGSTGQPKGVFGLHRGAVNRFHWMWQNYPFVQGEICCQKTSLNFVDSVWEIFGPLLQGVPTVIVPDSVLKDPQEFVATLASNNVTRLVLIPSLLRVLLETYRDMQLQLPQLKLWVSSGEALSIDLLQQFRQSLPDSTLLNLYGSSEVSADVTCHSLSPHAPLPNRILIGRPLANTQIYVLDANRKPVPVGVPGELHIGGDGLARGYLNRPELTAEKFIPNPFPFSDKKSAACLYKTGDLARYLPNGEIEYIGRIDHQVKVRGFRIELGEIEAHLRQHPKVRETVVVVRSDSADSQRIVAYVVFKKEQTLTITELRDFLESKLPDYMVPAAFVMLAALPLTPNGKVDRKALPAPETTRPELEAVYHLPQTEVEKAIANIWEESLQIEDVGIHDNFFELGGHSLLLVQVHSKLQKIFQQDFPLVEMFQYPTISRLAIYFGQESREQQSFTQHSHRPESRTTSLQRRKQARKEHRATQKGVSSQ